jgi:hypothetical protein
VSRAKTRVLTPTFVAALQASRTVMKEALTRKALYGDDAEVARWAAEVLEHEKAVFTDGVRRAVD